MLTSLNEMPSAVTAFLATSEEIERIRFTETAVSFRQHLHQFQSQPGADAWADELETRFLELEAAGSRLISGRDQQQALFAQFAAILFHVGQELIVGEIQPRTAQNLAQAEADIAAALRVGEQSRIEVGAVLLSHNEPEPVHRGERSLPDLVERGGLERLQFARERDEVGGAWEGMVALAGDQTERGDQGLGKQQGAERGRATGRM